MIAAIKRTHAKLSRIALWPLAKLTANITRANRKIIRRAIRRRSGAAYLFAIFWFPTMTAAGIIWAVLSIHQKPDDLWPMLGVILLVAKKVMALLVFIAQQAAQNVKALYYYRRHFRSKGR